MKNLSTAEMQDVNGGGWIADAIEDLLCALSCAEPGGYEPEWPTGPKW